MAVRSASFSGRELTSGIDAFVTSYYGAMPQELEFQLEEGKIRAKGARSPVEMHIGDEPFVINPGGFGRQTYHLRHEFGHLGLSASTGFPVIRFEPFAWVLHTYGPKESTYWVRRTFEGICGELRSMVSRMDLFTDVQGFNFFESDRSFFVSRSHSSATFHEAGQFTGFVLGRRTSKSIYARIYDKTAEASPESMAYLPLLWAERHDPTQKVWRMEFELHRAVLKELQVETEDDALRCAGSIWAYLTESWLKIVEPSMFGGEVDPRWLLIQQASIRNGALPAKRVRSERMRASVDEVIPHLFSDLKQIAAIVGTNDFEATFDAAVQRLHQFEKDRRRSFPDEVHLRRTELGFNRELADHNA